MTQHWLTTLRVPSSSGITGEAVVLSFYTATADDIDGEQAAVNSQDLFIAFLVGNPGGVQVRTLAQYLSPTLSRAVDACGSQTYRMEDVPPRAPFFPQSFTLSTASSAAAMPRQVSCVLSYHGILEGVPEGQPGVLGQPRPRQRRRGRFYIGPLNNAAQTQAGAVESVPSPDFIGDLCKAAKSLRDKVAAPASPAGWVGHSRVANDYWGVDSGWVDNRWDIQRRRANQVKIRTEWF